MVERLVVTRAAFAAAVEAVEKKTVSLRDGFSATDVVEAAFAAAGVGVEQAPAPPIVVALTVIRDLLNQMTGRQIDIGTLVGCLRQVEEALARAEEERGHAG